MDRPLTTCQECRRRKLGCDRVITFHVDESDTPTDNIIDSTVRARDVGLGASRCVNHWQHGDEG